MDYKETAKEIIASVGGKENIKSVVHCMTRLRFVLKDEDVADTEKVKGIPGVLNVVCGGGQYQVVIGTKVTKVYDEVVGEIEAQGGKVENSGQGEVQKKPLDKMIDMISGVFTPALGLLGASGILKGMASLLLALGMVTKSSGSWIFLQGIGNAFFYFFPVILGYTSALKFGLSPILGITIGASLVAPQFTGLLNSGQELYVLFAGTIFEAPVYFEIFGIPVLMMEYAQSVIPVIITVFIASKLEKRLRKVIPSAIQMFAVPMLTMLISVVLTFILFGPITIWISACISVAVKAAYDLNPIIAGMFIGSIWQVLVLFGLHWGLQPIGLNNFAQFGYDPIMCLMYGTPFATVGAVLGVMLKTKKKDVKALCVSCAATGMVGVTEPAMYGITMPRKLPYYFALVGSAIGGGILGAFGSKIYSPLAGGIFALPNYINNGIIDKGFWGAVIAVACACLSSLILTVVFWKEKE